MADTSQLSGLYYALPRNFIDINVRYIERVFYPGIYSAYAAELLGIADARSRETKEYEITEIQLVQGTEPDPAMGYTIGWDPDGKKGGYGLFRLSEQGTLLYFSNQADQKNNTGAIRHEKKIVKQVTEFNGTQEKEGNVPVFMLHAESNLKNISDTVFMEESIKDSASPRPIKVINKVTQKNGRERAAAAADKFFTVRDNRMHLLSGYQEVPYTADALKYMCMELEKLESEYLALFTGKSIERNLVYTFRYVPVAKADTAALPLFRFSANSGIGGPTDEEGLVVFLRAKQEIENMSNVDSSGSTENAIFYRVPSPVDYEVYTDYMVYVRERIYISQFGKVASIPVRPNIEILMDPCTGRIESLKSN